MGEQASAQITNAPAVAPPMATSMLQRKCECGNHTIAEPECDSCKKHKGKKLAAGRATSGGYPGSAVAFGQEFPDQNGLQTRSSSFTGIGRRRDFTRLPIKSGSCPYSSVAINPAGDFYEQEAERVAHHVMRLPAALPNLTHKLHARLPELRSTSEWRAPMRSTGRGIGAAPGLALVQQVLKTGGEPLNERVRGFMEERFGYDFGSVRVHTGQLATQSAQSINALAYTVGKDVVFSEAEYKPESSDGRRLLAHELAHVVQQANTGSGAVFIQRQAADSGSADEADEADSDVSDAAQEADSDSNGGHQAHHHHSEGAQQDDENLPCCRDYEREEKKKEKKRRVTKNTVLQSPRFKRFQALQQVLAGNVRSLGDVGDDIRHVKEALIDAGAYTPTMLQRTERDAESLIGSNTFDRLMRRALRRFQRREGLKTTGVLDAQTMLALDDRFPPQPQLQNATWPAKWNIECLLKILCPWNKPLVDRLRGGVPPVKSADAIVVTNAKKGTDGRWVTEQKKSAGLADSAAQLIYLLKDQTCEDASATVYHEMWHIDQPLYEDTLDKEVDAEFSALEWANDLGIRGAEKFLDQQGGVSHEEVKTKVQERYQIDPTERPDLKARLDKRGAVSVSPMEMAAKVPPGHVVQVEVNPTGLKEVNPKQWNCDPGDRKRCRWCWPRIKLPKIPIKKFRKSIKRLGDRAKDRWNRLCRKGKGLVDCPVWKK